MSISMNHLYDDTNNDPPKYLVVNVGGKHFLELSDVMYTQCAYIRMAFKARTKEAVDYHFKFPNEDPKEFAQFTLLLNPYGKVNSSNLHVTLKWSKILGVSLRRHECDDFVRAKLRTSGRITIEALMKQYFQPSHYYNLPKTKTLCMAVIRDALSKTTHMTVHDILKAVNMALCCDECRKAWYPTMEKVYAQTKKPFLDRGEQDKVLYHLKFHLERRLDEERRNRTKKRRNRQDPPVSYRPTARMIARGKAPRTKA